MRAKQEDWKDRTITLCNYGRRPSEIARAFGLADGTVRKWIRQWRKESPELFDDYVSD